MEDLTLAGTGNMIKLKNIIKEIKVNKPLNKKEVLNWWFNEGNIYLLSYLTHYPSVKELIAGGGYNNLEEYLTDDFGLEQYQVKSFIEYIEAYYRIFKPNEIKVAVFGDKDGYDVKGTPYKNIIIDYLEGGYYYLYCNNY